MLLDLTGSESTVWRLSAEASGPVGSWDASVDVEELRCPVNPNHKRGGRRLSQLHVHFNTKELHNDFLWTWQSDCLIKKSATDALRRAGVTGFDIRPAVVYWRGDLKSLDYDEFIVTGWGGIARLDSGVAVTDLCPECDYIHYSGVTDWKRLIDWSQWNGSDMFLVWPLPRYILLTDKGRSKVHDLGLTGLSIDSLETLPRPDGFSPGRLSYWLPEEVILRSNIPKEIL
jgi:hypothetical protein